MRDVVSQSPAYTNATRPQREVEKRYSGESKFTQSVLKTFRCSYGYIFLVSVKLNSTQLLESSVFAPITTKRDLL